MFSKTQHNMKPRLVKCVACNTTKMTNEPDPRCSTCNWAMITVLKFMFPKEEKK